VAGIAGHAITCSVSEFEVTQRVVGAQLQIVMLWLGTVRLRDGECSENSYPQCECPNCGIYDIRCNENVIQ
jgi:hypothetical protein